MSETERIETKRLILCRPKLEDASEMFERYCHDEDVTKYLTWPRHQSIADTEAFIQFSDQEWEKWPIGPYLVRDKEKGKLLGSTGLVFETNNRASTGYVLARDAWGQGYASECLRKMMSLARRVGVKRLYALAYPSHRASRRVLEKKGFELEGVLRAYAEFMNLNPGSVEDVVCYSWLPQEAD